MIVILTSVTLLSLSLWLQLPVKLFESSLELHQQCLRTLPTTVENLKSLEALVCGENLKNLELKLLLSQTSLIHIFVVSGSHFLFLHKILAWVFRSRWFAFLPLTFYAMATLCQPPAVRSLVFLLLAEASRHFKLFCSPCVLIFISALLCVSVFPEWVGSRSLLMSLMAALALTVMSELLGPDRHSLAGVFAVQSGVYLVMGFCLWGLSNLHPLGIVLNITLGPLIGLLLFPVSLLVVLFPFFGPLFDFLMNSLIWILKASSEVLLLPPLDSALSVGIQWGLFLLLLISSFFYLITQKRTRAHAL